MVTYAVVPHKFQFPLMYSFLYSLAIASISCMICTPVCVVNQATYLVMSITTIFFCTKMVNVSVFMIMLHTRFKASLSLSPNYCWTNDGGLTGFDCIYYFFIFSVFIKNQKPANFPVYCGIFSGYFISDKNRSVLFRDQLYVFWDRHYSGSVFDSVCFNPFFRSEMGNQLLLDLY